MKISRFNVDLGNYITKILFFSSSCAVFFLIPPSLGTNQGIYLNLKFHGLGNKCKSVHSNIMETLTSSEDG